MIFGERLKQERQKKGWSQEELAQKLYVSRQAISKWETAQNYPGIEILLQISDLFGLTVDELLRSDEELKKKVINDGRHLAHPNLKIFFDITFLIGFALMVLRLGVFLINRFTTMDVALFGEGLFWNLGTFLLLVVGGIGSDFLKGRFRKNEAAPRRLD